MHGACRLLNTGCSMKSATPDDGAPLITAKLALQGVAELSLPTATGSIDPSRFSTPSSVFSDPAEPPPRA
jgi:hypothetical protein